MEEYTFMKKYLLGLIILSMLIFTGCSKEENKPEENKPEVQPPKQEEPQKEEPKNEEPNEGEQQGSKIDQFPEAAQGKFTDLSITFKDTREKVIKELGEPDEITTWQGSDLYIYNNIGIYIDPTEEKVTGLTAGEGYRTYGIKIGMTAEEIKNVLGEPDYEGENFESGAYVLEYEAGDYVVEVSLDPEGKKSAGITLYSYNY
jgi:hypothetical protein